MQTDVLYSGGVFHFNKPDRRPICSHSCLDPLPQSPFLKPVPGELAAAALYCVCSSVVCQAPLSATVLAAVNWAPHCPQHEGRHVLIQ